MSLTKNEREPYLITDELVSVETDIDPLSLDDAKDFLEIGHDQDDTKIQAFINAAEDIFQRVSGHYLDEQKRRVEWDQVSHNITIPSTPVNSISSVEVLYQGSVQKSMSVDDFYLHGSNPPNLRSIETLSFTAKRDTFRVEFIAGYDSKDDVPNGIYEVLKRMVADLHENRVSMDVASGTQAHELPMDWKTLILPFKITKI